MNDEILKTIGALFLQGQHMKDKLELALELVRKLKSGEIALDRVVVLPDGLHILPPEPVAVQDEVPQVV